MFLKTPKNPVITKKQVAERQNLPDLTYKWNLKQKMIQMNLFT